VCKNRPQSWPVIILSTLSPSAIGATEERNILLNIDPNFKMDRTEPLRNVLRTEMNGKFTKITIVCSGRGIWNKHEMM
jgi:hypothetical protein